MTTRIMDSADVDDGAELGDGTSVWHLAQVREGVRMGRGCIVGRGAYIGTGVQMGDHCKVQNYALVYEPAVLERRRVHRPRRGAHQRHVPARGQPRRLAQERARLAAGGRHGPRGRLDRRARGVRRAGDDRPLGHGGSRAVVTRDVPDFALVAGVPARRIKWVGRAGVPLDRDRRRAGGGARAPRSCTQENDGLLTPTEEEDV